MHILILIGVLIGFALFFGTTMITVKQPAGSYYQNVFHAGPPSGNTTLVIDPSDFDGLDFVDADGFLRPGTPLLKDGTPSDGVGEPTIFVVPYAVQIAKSNATADLTAATNNSIAVATKGDLLQAAIEANLERVLTADEIANIESTGRFLLL